MDRDIPWLQDTAAQDTWGLWGVAYRDVVILDGDNEVYSVFNLTTNSLSVPANYDALKALLVQAAGTL